MSCRAILFDLDGVLVDSRECIELIWHAWAAERGLDPADFLRVAHGRRIAETLRLVAPQVDAAAEAAVLDAMEEVETRGLRAAPGAGALLRQLSEAQRAHRHVGKSSRRDAAPAYSGVADPGGVRHGGRRRAW